MRASEFINLIQENIDKYGDFPLYADGDFYYTESIAIEMMLTEVGVIGTIKNEKLLGFYKDKR
jgi:hypothetical protein